MALSTRQGFASYSLTPTTPWAWLSDSSDSLLQALNEPVDVSAWDWSQLDPRNMDSFEFTPGVTPFASLRFIAITILGYLVAIHLGNVLMAGFSRFRLRGVTVVHNAFLCLWSAWMAYGIGAHIYSRQTDVGFAGWTCHASPDKVLFTNGRAGYLLYMYYISKYWELLDTVLIVAKKNPLIFLHYYHHAVVLAMTYFWLYTDFGFGSWAMLCNTVVHVFMYYYYAVAAMGHRPWWKKYLTSLQIVQFVGNTAVSIPFAYQVFFKNNAMFGDRLNCLGGPTFAVSLAINFSFLALFVQFARRTYGGAKAGSKSKGADSKKTN